jgi:hypothetical protein
MLKNSIRIILLRRFHVRILRQAFTIDEGMSAWNGAPANADKAGVTKDLSILHYNHWRGIFS